MKKKIVSLVLIFIMLVAGMFTLAGCGESNNDDSSKKDNDTGSLNKTNTITNIEKIGEDTRELEDFKSADHGYIIGYTDGKFNNFDPDLTDEEVAEFVELADDISVSNKLSSNVDSQSGNTYEVELFNKDGHSLIECFVDSNHDLYYIVYNENGTKYYSITSTKLKTWVEKLISKQS